MNKYHEKYGKVYHEWASFGNLLGVAGNGDVTWRAYGLVYTRGGYAGPGGWHEDVA